MRMIEPLNRSLDGLHFDDKLQFVEEPVKIMDREVKQLRQSRVPIVKVAFGYYREALSVVICIVDCSIHSRRSIRHEMDVKSAFLYGTIEEEVYVCQPPSFEDPQFPDKVYKVEKALYSLHQAPRAWYETLQVYVDDIIFGSTKKSLCVEFEQMMHKRFQMSSMGELTFFLGLQVKQKDDGIFISQDKYVADILKKFDFVTVKTASTPIETNKALFKDDEAEDVDVHLYRSMIGSLMYLTASSLYIMWLFVHEIHIDLGSFSGTKKVIMLELALTGNPQQEVVNFLAKGVVDSKSNA
ncbi:putative ribonuclease H-like domain-containing protein [Tanacetum coccineum]